MWARFSRLERASPAVLQTIHRSLCPAQLVGDFVGRETQHVAEEEDQPLLVGQRLKRIAKRGARVRISLDNRSAPGRQLVRRQRTASAEMVEGGIPRDPQEPGGEGRDALVVALQAAEHLDEHVVRDVLGVVRFVDDALDVTLHDAGEADVAVLYRRAIAVSRTCYRLHDEFVVASDAGSGM